VTQSEVDQKLREDAEAAERTYKVLVRVAYGGGVLTLDSNVSFSCRVWLV
jgi:hypothetical protein